METVAAGFTCFLLLILRVPTPDAPDPTESGFDLFVVAAVTVVALSDTGTLRLSAATGGGGVALAESDKVRRLDAAGGDGKFTLSDFFFLAATRGDGTALAAETDKCRPVVIVEVEGVALAKANDFELGGFAAAESEGIG